MKKILVTLSFVLGLAGNLMAQVIAIEGAIKDSKFNTPLAYANVYMERSGYGTISNEQGKFKLVIPESNGSDNLIVSFIGYLPISINIEEVEYPLEIQMKEDLTTLEEVVVTGLTAQSIVQKALDLVADNYQQRPYRSDGFYRVTSEKDQSYLHLSEAVFELFHSVSGKPKQQFKLDKMRAIKDERASRGIDLGLRPSSIFGFDLVNNQESIALLDEKTLNNHIFSVKGSKMINGKEAFIIEFDQKQTKKPGYKGFMLIDKETFAFVYFDFGLSPVGMAYHKYGDASLRALMKIVGIEINMSRDNYQIHYKKSGDKYYLNNVGNDATLTFKSNREHYNFTTDTRVDYLVSRIEPDQSIPFTNDEILRQGKLIEEQNSDYDPEFWKDYNIVLPTSDFNSIAKQLEANNRANDLKVELEERINKFPKDTRLRIDSILSFYNGKGLFNGNALVSDEGEVIFHKSYNNEKTHNTEDSQFRIGSTSKTFTSMVVAQLEAQGKLNYSDPIRKYLPDYLYGQIKIDQLLSHQSGIPDFLSNQAYSAQILSHKFSNEEVVEKFCSDSLDFEPGSQFEYSNSNYVILSRIAEKIVKMDFADILDQFIFEPLNMSDSYFGGSQESTHLVTGFLYGQPEPRYNIQNVSGAGGVVTTTNDLFKWSKALDGDQLLSKANLELIFTPQVEYSDWEAYYGLGWMIDRYMFSASKKHQIIYHPGTDMGFYSMFLKQPDSGITIVLLSNTGEFPRFEITDLILDELN